MVRGGGAGAVNYQFMLELAKLSEDALRVLRNIGPTVQVASGRARGRTFRAWMMMVKVSVLSVRLVRTVQIDNIHYVKYIGANG